MINKITSNLQWYIKITIAFAFINILARIYDFFMINSQMLSNLISFTNLLQDVLLDVMLSFAISGIILVIYALFSLINRKLSRIIVAFIFAILIIANFGLIIYYSETLMPLGQELYIYKFNSIINIIQLSGGVKLATIYPLILGVAIFIVLLFVLKKIRIPNIIVSFSVFILLFTAASTNIYIYSPSSFHDEQSFFNNTNKLVYFIKASVKYYKKNTEILEQYKSLNVEEYQNSDLEGKIYLSTAFPFYHRDSKDSKLAFYFNNLPIGEKPNVVFIVVESLCHDLSGKYSPNYSFTPFLDSLTEHSLYWRNAFSSSERTFGVLPTVLASLPPATKGFMDEYKKFPDFVSLPKSLKMNNYSSRMFYGGWEAFTNMDKFVYKCGIDTIYNKFADSEEMPRVENNFTWGYGDEVLFSKSFNYLDSISGPYFNLYLTLSTHTPFSINNQDKYINIIEDIIPNIKGERVRKYVKNHKKELSTFIMFDEQLRSFFKEYSKREDFKKTIFVITGDHKSILFQYRNNLDKYYVPLIIYSPLLKGPKEFGAVVSHFDITPAISKLLSDKYALKMPLFTQYLGSDLDTSSGFSANERLFFMRNSRVVNEYMYKNKFIAGDKLYEVNDLLQLTPLQDDALRDKMKKELKDYMKIQIYSVRNNRLIK